MNKVVSYSELWKAPATTTVNNLNDIWAHVNYGGFDGWVGLVHLGIKYGTYTEAPAPTPVDNKPASIDMTLSAGSVVIIRNTAGVELWKGTA